MWSNAFKYDVEYGALITPQGLLVSKYEQTGTDDLWQGYRHYKKNNKYYMIFNNSTHRVIGHIHIHQDIEINYWSFVGEGGNDLETVKGHPGMLFFLMTADKGLQGLRYDGTDFRSLRGMKKYNVNSLLNGDFKLIPFILNY